MATGFTSHFSCDAVRYPDTLLAWVLCITIWTNSCTSIYFRCTEGLGAEIEVHLFDTKFITVETAAASQHIADLGASGRGEQCFQKNEVLLQFQQ